MTLPRLIVGLGNPGAEYARTRHNAGCWWVDEIARAHSVSLRLESRFSGLMGRFTHPDGECYLLQPQTFMNASGRSVSALAKFFKITPEEILVAHDELDLSPGTARFKQGGGHGGHNGLRDITSALGTPQFWRLRLGIGHPGEKSEVVNFVLKPPRKEESEAIDEALWRALQVLPLLLKGAMPAAMKQLHTLDK